MFSLIQRYSRFIKAKAGTELWWVVLVIEKLEGSRDENLPGVLFVDESHKDDHLVSDCEQGT